MLGEVGLNTYYFNIVRFLEHLLLEVNKMKISSWHVLYENINVMQIQRVLNILIFCLK